MTNPGNTYAINKSRPRKEQFAALVAVRSIGKREVLKRLELLSE